MAAAVATSTTPIALLARNMENTYTEICLSIPKTQPINLSKSIFTEKKTAVTNAKKKNLRSP